jgi:predicted HTH transcriptional regulator
MDITKKDINSITFEEIVEFCEQRVIENLFLDYKKNKPGDLSKHIAGFSNASGGLIIIGIEEDANGYPVAWEGIDNVNKPTDWAHQMANNVVPFPSYEAAVTNEVEGKVFLLVRILEGDSTPYVTRNDPTVWVRTGNVRTPVDQANREDLLRLVARSSGAAQNRKIVDDQLEFEFRQLEHHRTEFERRNRTRLGNLTTRNDSQKSLLRVTVTPFNPSRSIIDIPELSNVNILLQKFTPSGTDLASFASGVYPIANGLANVRHTSTGQVESIQVKNNGAIVYVDEID